MQIVDIDIGEERDQQQIRSGEDHRRGEVSPPTRPHQYRPAFHVCRIQPRVLARDLSHLVASRRTFLGAVPPKLVRLFTELSTDEHVEDVRVDARLDRLHLMQRQLGKRNLVGRRPRHDPAGYVMGFAERHCQRADQPIGKIGRGRIALVRRLAHARGIGNHVAHHAGHGGDRQHQGGERIHGAFLVLLHVLLIGERQSLHHHEQRGERADDAASLGAHQLGGVRIALLRHDRGAGGEPIRQQHEARSAASSRSRSPRRNATDARP